MPNSWASQDGWHEMTVKKTQDEVVHMLPLGKISGMIFIFNRVF